jgi:Protein of unknown function (DUF2793)
MRSRPNIMVCFGEWDMAEIQSGRHHLPFLAVAQAGKEITHNEALVLIDALLHPVVEGQVSAPPVLDGSDAGKCWIIGPAPTGLWSGQDGKIGCWTGSGWRFLNAVSGMRVRNAATNCDIVRTGSYWTTAPAIADPVAGSVIDVEARALLSTLLSHFRMIGQFTS